jgi:O-antigen ligase
MFLQEPIAGVGLGQFQARFVTGQYSHSDIIETLSTTGIVGFLLYQSFFVLLLVRLRRLLRMTRDPLERYQYKTMALAIVVIILFGLGGPHINSQPVFTFLATLSAYTWTKLHERRGGQVARPLGPQDPDLPRTQFRR